MSDATSSHNLLPGIFKSHDGRVIKPEDVGNVLTWVHNAIRKTKSELDYAHNVVKREYLHECLREFTWRFNPN